MQGDVRELSAQTLLEQKAGRIAIKMARIADDRDVLRVRFPLIRSVQMQGELEVLLTLVTSQGNVVPIVDKFEEFPSDHLIAQLMLVSD